MIGFSVPSTSLSFIQLLFQLIERLTLGDVVLALSSHALYTQRHMLYCLLQFNPLKIYIFKLFTFLRTQVILDHFCLQIHVLAWLCLHEVHLLKLTVLRQAIHDVHSISLYILIGSLIERLLNRASQLDIVARQMEVWSFLFG